MQREIYEVHARIIDANGVSNPLSGYPKLFDSHLYNDDIEKARKRAYGEYHEVLGAMCKRDDRQAQCAMIIRGSDGVQIERTYLGEIAPLPEPTFTVTVENGRGDGTYEAGKPVIIIADNPTAGQIFDHWEGMDNMSFINSDIYMPNATFIMPYNDVTVTAIYSGDPDAEINENEDEP